MRQGSRSAYLPCNITPGGPARLALCYRGDTRFCFPGAWPPVYREFEWDAVCVCIELRCWSGWHCVVNYDPSFAPVLFVLQVTRPVSAKSVLEAGRCAWIYPRPCPNIAARHKRRQHRTLPVVRYGLATDSDVPAIAMR